MELKVPFSKISLQHVPRGENSQADALARWASSLVIPSRGYQDLTVAEQRILPTGGILPSYITSVHTVSVYEIETGDWHEPLRDYLQYGVLPPDPKMKAEIRRKAPRYVLLNNTLYRRSYEGVLLRCLTGEEAKIAF